jgi:hypothetical protein
MVLLENFTGEMCPSDRKAFLASGVNDIRAEMLAQVGKRFEKYQIEDLFFEASVLDPLSSRYAKPAFMDYNQRLRNLKIKCDNAEKEWLDNERLRASPLKRSAPDLNGDILKSDSQDGAHGLGPIPKKIRSNSNPMASQLMDSKKENLMFEENDENLMMISKGASMYNAEARKKDTHMGNGREDWHVLDTYIEICEKVNKYIENEAQGVGVLPFQFLSCDD